MSQCELSERYKAVHLFIMLRWHYGCEMVIYGGPLSSTSEYWFWKERHNMTLCHVSGFIVFAMRVKEKRATRGTYSPSRQEMNGSRMDMGNQLKIPPPERLIWCSHSRSVSKRLPHTLLPQVLIGRSTRGAVSRKCPASNFYSDVQSPSFLWSIVSSVTVALLRVGGT